MNDLDTIFKTFDKIMESGFDVNKASLQNKVVVMITTAQGVIDNGGFQYFFEYDFGDAPNMQDFVMIYKEIGAEECAVAIEKALAIYNSKKQSTYDSLDDVMFKESDNNFKKLNKYIEETFV